MENRIEILSLHVNILKCLLLWPRPSLNNAVNTCLLYGYFFLSFLFCTPVIWAVLYQIYVGIDDVNILLEALIGICDIIGYMVAYSCFLKNKVVIENIIKDINMFLKYCHPSVIRHTDTICTRFTKYMLVYVSVGVALNLFWPLMSRKQCMAQKGSDFYLRHDPCGMPTHNFYPFDASQPKMFAIVFLIEGIFLCHICYVFSTVTVTIIGLLMHITAQLKHCGLRFENVSYEREENNLYTTGQHEFILCIKYHQSILVYARRTFSVFSAVVVAYITVTSFATAVIGYQIVQANNIQDRVRYTMLLLAWGLLFFLICFHAQKVQDESVAVANSVYNSAWYKSGINIDMKKNIIMVIARAQQPLYFKIEYLGIISLSRFVAVMKTAYSFFTILLTITENN